MLDLELDDKIPILLFEIGGMELPKPAWIPSDLELWEFRLIGRLLVP